MKQTAIKTVRASSAAKARAAYQAIVIQRWMDSGMTKAQIVAKLEKNKRHAASKKKRETLNKQGKFTENQLSRMDNGKPINKTIAISQVRVQKVEEPITKVVTARELLGLFESKVSLMNDMVHLMKQALVELEK